MANLKEFNFWLQTAAPLWKAATHGLRMAGFCGASELASSHREEEEEIVSVSAGDAGRQAAKNLGAEQSRDLQGDAC